jgi:hypothetical protein
MKPETFTVTAVDALEPGEAFTIAGVYERDRRPRWLRVWHRVIGHKPKRRLKEFRVIGVLASGGVVNLPEDHA